MNARMRQAAGISAGFHLLLTWVALMTPLVPPQSPAAPPALVEIVSAGDFVPPQLLSLGDMMPGDGVMENAVDPGTVPDAAGPAAAADMAEPAGGRGAAPIGNPTDDPAAASPLPPLLQGNTDIPSLAPLAGGVATSNKPVEPVAGYASGNVPGGSGGEGDGSGYGDGSGGGGGGGTRILRGPAPKYPVAARKAGWEGAVVVSILVDESGRAAAVTVRESSRYAALDEAAVAAVKQWRFAPARRNGEPVVSTHTVRVRFRLTDPQ